MSHGTCLFLGTGASSGTPVIGCDCAVCSSLSPYNKRLRPSVLLRVGGKVLLIDAGSDIRQQALLYKICHLDGVLLTHAHHDHISGIDDLKPFFFQKNRPIPCLLSQESFNDVQKHYGYLLNRFDVHVLKGDSGNEEFEGIKVLHFSYRQSGMKVTGFRFGDFAYVSDIREYEKDIFDSLRGVRVLVISAIRAKASSAHFSVDEAVQFARSVQELSGEPVETWLTHISHHMDHGMQLPSGTHMAYDGLTIDFRI